MTADAVTALTGAVARTGTTAQGHQLGQRGMDAIDRAPLQHWPRSLPHQGNGTSRSNSAQRACQPLPNNDGGTLPGFDGGFPSFDGGFPGFDGGVPDLCSLFGSPCMSGECCDFSIPMPACVARGAMCTLTGGVCQGSGVCQ